jgi:hypothetical protein
MGWWIAAGAVLVVAAVVTGWSVRRLIRREAALRLSLARLDGLAARAGEVVASLERTAGAARERRCRLVAAEPAGAPEGPHGAARQ